MAKKEDGPSTEVETVGVGMAYADAVRRGELSFVDDVDEFDFFAGSDELIKDEQIDALVGVPFAVLGVTFRGGYTREIAGQKFLGDYASLQIVTGDEKAFARAKVDRETCPYGTGEVLRFNDGSTGVRRQIVQYLVGKGYVKVNKLDPKELKSGGKLGESDYDIPVSLWEDAVVGEVTTTSEGDIVYDVTFPRPLVIMRGLRLSEYTNENGKNVTRYFA